MLPVPLRFAPRLHVCATRPLRWLSRRALPIPRFGPFGCHGAIALPPTLHLLWLSARHRWHPITRRSWPSLAPRLAPIVLPFQSSFCGPFPHPRRCFQGALVSRLQPFASALFWPRPAALIVAPAAHPSSPRRPGPFQARQW